jgi:menaquinone-9 beta-reductase
VKSFTSPSARSTEVDVLVVGAGPAGAAAAYHLARHGTNVLAVDRATFPREKVCGDGLTPRGVKQLLAMGIDVADPGFTRIVGLRSYGSDGFVLELPWPEVSSFPDFGVVRTRHDLDALLVDAARKAGALVWEGTEAERPIVDRGWVTGAVVRRGDGEPEEVRARFVIACDGAASRFGQPAGVRRDPARPLGVAARRYFRTPRPLQPYFESWLNLRHEGRYLPGYGWLFPVGDGIVNVGAGLLNTSRDFKHLSGKKVYEVFLRQLPEEWELIEERAVGGLMSGPLPMGLNRRPAAVPGLLLAGDAGGVVNPFNGEGIAYAMETAAMAAELVHESLVLGRPALAHLYPTLLRERYARYYALGRAFVRVIGRPAIMEAAVRYGLPRERLMRFLLKLMANITDGRTGDADDRVMSALVRLAPRR